MIEYISVALVALNLVATLGALVMLVRWVRMVDDLADEVADEVAARLTPPVVEDSGPPDPTTQPREFLAWLETANPRERLTDPPMIGDVTVRDWLVHYQGRTENVWAAVVYHFYERARQDPAVATYFRNADLDTLRNHFLRALDLVASKGLTVGTVKAMQNRHARVSGVRHDGAGRPYEVSITGDVYERVIGHLVEVLTAYGVPPDGIAALARTIAPLRPVIVRA